MTNNPNRRSRSATPIQRNDNLWMTIASYANELAPVVGPLLAAVGQTADAIDRADRHRRCLDAMWEEPEDWN